MMARIATSGGGSEGRDSCFDMQAFSLRWRARSQRRDWEASGADSPGNYIPGLCVVHDPGFNPGEENREWSHREFARRHREQVTGLRHRPSLIRQKKVACPSAGT